MSGFLFNSLRNSSKNYRDKLALIFNDNEQYSFYEFYTETWKFITYLKKLKLKKGDIIYLGLGTCIEFCCLLYAANYLGIVVIPISTKLKEEGFKHLVETIPLHCIFYDEKKLSFIKEQKGTFICIDSTDLKNAIINIKSQEDINTESNDNAVIMFTSGTTSLPKGAVITNQNLEAAIKAYESTLKLTKDDNTILAVPIFHITGLVAILGLFVYLGGTIYLESRFNAQNVLKLIEKYNITFLHGSPTVFSLLHSALLNKKGSSSFNSLKSIACGAGRLNKGTVQALKELFPNAAIHSVYGLTESTSPFTIYRGDLSLTENCESSGTVVDGAELQIRDKEGRVLGKNKVGVIWIKGPMVVQSYMPVTEENKKLFDNSFLNTGDLGLLDENNQLIVKDRVKDIIDRGGEKIFCPEVESIISLFPDVLEVALVPKKDELYGEVPVAVIRTNNNTKINIEELHRFLSTHLAHFQIPQEFIFTDDFPRTENGKINKRLLKNKINI